MQWRASHTVLMEMPTPLEPGEAANCHDHQNRERHHLGAGEKTDRNLPERLCAIRELACLAGELYGVLAAINQASDLIGYSCGLVVGRLVDHRGAGCGD